jgi:hypothetical protein
MNNIINWLKDLINNIIFAISDITNTFIRMIFFFYENIKYFYKFIKYKCYSIKINYYDHYKRVYYLDRLSMKDIPETFYALYLEIYKYIIVCINTLYIVKNYILNIFEKILNYILNIFEKILNYILNIFEKIFNYINYLYNFNWVNYFNNIINNIINYLYNFNWANEFNNIINYLFNFWLSWVNFIKMTDWSFFFIELYYNIKITLLFWVGNIILIILNPCIRILWSIKFMFIDTFIAYIVLPLYLKIFHWFLDYQKIEEDGFGIYGEPVTFISYNNRFELLIEKYAKYLIDLYAPVRKTIHPIIEFLVVNYWHFALGLPVLWFILESLNLRWYWKGHVYVFVFCYFLKEHLHVYTHWIYLTWIIWFLFIMSGKYYKILFYFRHRRIYLKEKEEIDLIIRESIMYQKQQARIKARKAIIYFTYDEIEEYVLNQIALFFIWLKNTIISIIKKTRKMTILNIKLIKKLIKKTIKRIIFFVINFIINVTFIIKLITKNIIRLIVFLINFLINFIFKIVIFLVFFIIDIIFMIFMVIFFIIEKLKFIKNYINLLWNIIKYIIFIIINIIYFIIKPIFNKIYIIKKIIIIKLQKLVTIQFINPKIKINFFKIIQFIINIFIKIFTIIAFSLSLIYICIYYFIKLLFKIFYYIYINKHVHFFCHVTGVFLIFLFYMYLSLRYIVFLQDGVFNTFFILTKQDLYFFYIEIFNLISIAYENYLTNILETYSHSYNNKIFLYMQNNDPIIYEFINKDGKKKLIKKILPLDQFYYYLNFRSDISFRSDIIYNNNKSLMSPIEYTDTIEHITYTKKYSLKQGVIPYDLTFPHSNFEGFTFKTTNYNIVFYNAINNLFIEVLFNALKHYFNDLYEIFISFSIYHFCIDTILMILDLFRQLIIFILDLAEVQAYSTKGLLTPYMFQDQLELEEDAAEAELPEIYEKLFPQYLTPEDKSLLSYTRFETQQLLLLEEHSKKYETEFIYQAVLLMLEKIDFYNMFQIAKKTFSFCYLNIPENFEEIVLKRNIKNA